ncbi:MAG: hypothetical protein JW863_15440 [Chitinispirillaceae bacterium]|nr:hypothetical protein [Chitinispirillaceae bacterium]
MTKFLTFKFVILSSFLFLAPFTSPLYSQGDDAFEMDAEDWDDEAIEDDPFLDEKPVAKENAPATPEKKETISPAPQKKPSADTQVKSEKSTPPRQATPPAPVVESKPKKVFSPIQPTPPNQQVSNSVKRAGPPFLMIARPVYAPYSNETKTKYISAVAEAYFHFKLGALPGIQVVPFERVANNIQYFRDFTRRISRTNYIETSRKIGATYLLYSEYEPKGKSVKFAVELYSITDNKKIVASTSEIGLSEFEDGLFDLLNEAAGALVGTIPRETQEFLAESVMGKNLRQIELLGNAIVSAGDYTKTNAEKAVSSFEKLVKGGNQHLARYIGAQNYARAQQFDLAIKVQNELYSAFSGKYPALSLQLATFQRMAKSYDAALNAADEAAGEPSLALVARIEKARIYEAQGNLNQAKSEYESVLSQGGEDGEIYFQLALVSIGLNNLQQAQNYLNKAAAAGRSLDQSDYYDLGLRYEALGTANEQAINAYRSSLGLQQDNVDAWQKLAEIYTSTGQQAEAAECYVSLFQINNNAYKEYLAKAGIMFENAGYLENARDAYSLFIARRFNDPEVTVRLAKLEMQGGNCKKAIDLVDDMDTTGEYGSDIIAINTQCGKEERRVVIPTNTNQKNWRGPFFWRIGSGVLTAGAIALSVLVDSYVQDKQNEYDNARTVDAVNEAHNALKDLQKKRNLCYLGVGVGMTSFGLSIALPIVFGK